MMAGRGGAANGQFGNTTPLYARAPAAQPAGAAPAQQPLAQQQAAASGPVPALRPAKQLREAEQVQAESKLSDSEAVVDRAAAARAPDASAKLAESLRGLAEKVQKQGRDGTLAAGGVAVTGYKVDVMVYLSDASPKTLEALKKLGFEQSAESKAVRLVIGSIDVRKLADLAKLDAVVSVRPVGA
jgi:hypothetical protein